MDKPNKLRQAYENLKLRENQLRNINVIVNSPLPKKKANKFEKHILPLYITRRYNAQQVFNKLYDKASVTERLQAEMRY